MVGGWRRLGLFWAVILGVTATGAAALQVMGPPDPVAVSTPMPPAPTTPALVAPQVVAPQVVAPILPTPTVEPSVIRPPDLALQEAAPDFPGRSLPRKATDGRVAMTYYARAAPLLDLRPTLAMLVVGLGQSQAESQAAVAMLPGAVSLGVSPYAGDPEPLLTAIRESGHEFLVTLPMESQGYPLNDSGPHALLTGADGTTNARNLEWVLSRMQGAVGLTGASDGLRGERFATATAIFEPVLEQLAERGLLYVDPRPGAPTWPGRVVATMIVDDPPDRASIDLKLAQLEQRARDGHPVIGLAGLPRPAIIDRIASWARGLEGRGVLLVPISALVHPAK